MLSEDNIQQEALLEMPYWHQFNQLASHTFPIMVGNSISVAAAFGNAVILTEISQSAVAANAYISSIKNLLIYPARAIFYSLQPLVGKAFQEKDYLLMRKYWIASLFLGVGLSVALSIPLLNIEHILLLLNQNEALAKITGYYFGFFVYALPSTMLIEISNELFITTDNQFLLIPGNLLRTGLELSLNFLFIKLLKMDLNGLILSAILQPIISSAILASYVICSKKFQDFKLCSIKRNPTSTDRIMPSLCQIKIEILKLGLPIAFQTLGSSGAYFIQILMLGQMDVYGMVAFNLCNQWALWIINLHISLSASTSVLIAERLSKNDPINARKMGQTAILTGAMISCVSMVIMSLAYKPMTDVLLHPDPANEKIIALSKFIMPLTGLCTIGLGLKFIASGAIRGYKETRIPMLMDTAGTLTGLGCSAILGFTADLGSIGVVIGDAIGLLLVAGLILKYFSNKTVVPNRYASMFHRREYNFLPLAAGEIIDEASVARLEP